MRPYSSENRLAAEYFSQFSSDPPEVRGLLEFLFWVFSQGHTAYPRQDLPQAWKDLVEILSERAEDTSLWKISEVQEPRWELLDRESRLFGPPESPVPFVLQGELLTLRQLYYKEEFLAKRLLDLKNASLPVPVDAQVPRFAALEGLQRQAVESALGQGVFLLSGGPGTGKTFTLTHILLQYLLKDPEIPVTLLAPTGRAADRIRLTIGQELAREEYAGWKLELREKLTTLRPRTIHSLVGDPSGTSLRGVVVVDEASMVDLHNLCALVRILEVGSCHLILSGDKDQLPSVENGAILADLTRNRDPPPLPTVVLTRCFRSGDVLVDISRGLVGFETRELNFGELKAAFVPGKLEWISLPSQALKAHTRTIKDLLAREVEKMAQALPGSRDCRLKQNPNGGIDPTEEARIRGHFSRLDSRIFLCAGRGGLLGTAQVNNQMARLMGAGSFGPGTPVLITRNNWELEVFNGDRGLVYEAPDHSRWVLLPRPGDLRLFPFRLLMGFLEEAWAITVHKSQGSEYRDVTVLLDEGSGNLLTREILYTGITRARNSAVILASEEALKISVSRRVQRSTGLPEALDRVRRIL